MATNDAQAARIALQNLRRAFGDVALIEAVKTVAANSFRQPFVRAGIDVRGCGQCAMKTGIEDRDLRHAGNYFFGDGEAVELGLGWAWGECNPSFDRGLLFFAEYPR